MPDRTTLALGLLFVGMCLAPAASRGEENTLTEAEKKAAEGKNWKTDVSGGIQRVAMKHGCHPFGNAKARAIVWNFPDGIPQHREPLYSPRPDMVAVEGRDRVSDVIEVAIAAGYSRIPVYEQGIDDIIGLIYTKDLMRADREGRSDIEVRNLVREAQFTPETKPVADLMREMQQGKFHMAIVVDEYGGTAGLVTLEDLIEELIGEIVDEYDVEEPTMEPLPNGEIRVNASPCTIPRSRTLQPRPTALVHVMMLRLCPPRRDPGHESFSSSGFPVRDCRWGTLPGRYPRLSC